MAFLNPEPEHEEMPDEDIAFKVAVLRGDHENLRRHVERLDSDISEIKTTLARTATKDDVAAVGTKIDSAINGLLRDALNAIPAKQTMWWTAVMAIAAIGTTLSAFHLFR